MGKHLAAFALAYLIGLAAATAGPGMGGWGFGGNPRNSDPALGYSWAYFEFARDAGAGAPVLGLDWVASLCSAWSALDPSPTQSGCYDAVTNTSAGGAWTTWGSGTASSSDMLLPNGAGGALVTSQRTTTAGGYATTSAIANNASGWTGCWLGVLDNSATTVRLINHSTATPAANFAWEVANISSGITVSVSNGTSATSASKAGTVTGALHLACGTWSAAAGIEACLDGACSAGTAQATMNSVSAKPTLNGLNGAASSSVAMRSLGWFFSSTRLSDAQIATLAHAVLADTPRGVVQGVANAALSLTRATVKSCPADTTGAALSILPSGRPCVMMGGLHVEATGTNDLLQSETLCTAPNVNVASCTADSTVSPAGTLTAETMNDVSGAALQGFTQPITTSSLTRHAFGCYVSAGTASSVTVKLTGTGNSAGDCTATATGLTGFQRVECTSTNAYAAGLTAVTTEIDVGTVVGDTGTLKVWGCMHEVGKNAGEKLSTYIPTTNASATRNAEYAYFTPTLTGGTWPGSIAASTVNMGFESGLGVPVMVDNGGAAGVNFFGIQGSASNAMSCQLQTGSGNKSTNLTGTTGAGTDRFSCFADGATLQGYFNGSGPYSAAATGAAITPLSRITIGSWGTGLTRHCNCSVSNVIYDTSTTRAR